MLRSAMRQNHAEINGRIQDNLCMQKNNFWGCREVLGANRSQEPIQSWWSDSALREANNLYWHPTARAREARPWRHNLFSSQRKTRALQSIAPPRIMESLLPKHLVRLVSMNGGSRPSGRSNFGRSDVSCFSDALDGLTFKRPEGRAPFARFMGNGLFQRMDANCDHELSRITRPPFYANSTMQEDGLPRHAPNRAEVELSPPNTAYSRLDPFSTASYCPPKPKAVRHYSLLRKEKKLRLHEARGEAPGKGRESPNLGLRAWRFPELS